jgi:hypothetical protein
LTASVSLRVGPWDQLHAYAPRPSAHFQVFVFDIYMFLSASFWA